MPGKVGWEGGGRKGVMGGLPFYNYNDLINTAVLHLCTRCNLAYILYFVYAVKKCKMDILWGKNQ